MTIQQIYTQYKIMPTLQLHQLRVAAIAKLVCENFETELDMNSVIQACLLHDMGNIIKSDLSRFPEFLKPEGLEYWQSVKEEFVKKYGPEEHVATEMIAKEISVPPVTMNLIQRIGFSQLDKIDSDGTFENKICSYADMRVGPYGVISIEERLTEGRKRYEGRKHSIASDRFESLSQSLQNIERRIFGRSNLKPESLTDEIIREEIEQLRNFVVSK